MVHCGDEDISGRYAIRRDHTVRWKVDDEEDGDDEEDIAWVQSGGCVECWGY